MDIASIIGENDAVLINDQGYRCQRIFTFPRKALSGAAVYFVRGSEIQKQMDRLDEQYDSVFLVSLDTGRLVGDHEGWTPIYHSRAEGGYYDNTDEKFLPYPTKAETMSTPVVVMKKNP